MPSPSERKWTSVPSPNHSTPTTLTNPVRLLARSPTDIWRPSRTTETFTAPYIYTAIGGSGAFQRAAVTVSGDWRTKFDQGGILLLWPAATATEQGLSTTRWVKAGVEVFEGRAAVSVVGTDGCSDWSLADLPSGGGGEGEAGSARIEITREDRTLWVHVLAREGRKALREVKWAFEGEERGEGGGEMWVGLYAAKPTADEGELADAREGVEVALSDFELETS